MSKPLKKFIEKRKSYLVDSMAKSGSLTCSDCDQPLFKSYTWVGCPCYGGIKHGITLKKNESGVRVHFSSQWDKENVEMLLAFLRNKNNNKDL